MNITNVTLSADDFTDDTIQFWGTPNRWAHNSPLIIYTSFVLPFLYTALILGACVLLHSAYLHRWKFNSVRIVTDIAAFFLMLEASFFLSCTIISTCSQFNVALLNGVFANCICGGIVQVFIILIKIYSLL